MKKLHSFAFYALATPIITLGAGPVLAQQSTDQGTYGSQSTQRDQGASKSGPMVMPGDQSTQRDQGASKTTPMVTPSDKNPQSDSASPRTSQSDQNKAREGAIQPAPRTSQSSPSAGSASQSDPKAAQSKSQADPKAAQSSQSAADRLNASNQASKQNKGFISSAPARGMHTNNLIGAKVKTTGDVDVGPVNDLIIDEDGQVVAIVVSVGGFLGMGEREVAIGWDDVTRSGSSDELVLQIDASRDELRSAPEFKKLDK